MGTTHLGALAPPGVPSWVVASVVVLRLTIEWGVGMRRQDPSYGEVVHTSFTSWPFAEEVTALGLDARRWSTGLCACVLQGVRTLVPEEGVAYIVNARTPAVPLLPRVQCT